MLTFISTYYLLNAGIGAACGALSYEGRCTNEQCAQALSWGLISGTVMLALLMLFMTSVLNNGGSL